MTLEEIDALVKKGKMSEALPALKKLKKPTTHNERVLYASIARRVGEPLLGLKQLKPVVRNSKNCTEPEKLEYALNLLGYNIYTEAFELLNSLNSKLGEVLLAKAFGNIYFWQYEEALQYLEKYLQLELTDYKRLVAQINQILCLIHVNPQGAMEHLSPALFASLTKHKAMRLLANAHMLKAHALVLLNQNQEALAATAEANNLMKGEASFDRLWIEKWEALARLRAHATDENLRAVLNFRAKIRQLPDWEAVREIDFYLGLWVRNRSVLPRVYFGTPFRAFRERVRKMSGIDFDAQKQFLWTINYGSEAKQVLELDRLVGELEDQELMGNLLRALASDFYRPISIGDLHQRLYLNEHFDPDSGPKRIYRANERLRKILLKMDCPLSIDATSGFKLIASRPFGLVVPNPERATETKADSRIAKLKAHFESKTFSVSDVEKLLGQPRRTCQTWLKQMCESGQLEKTGSARWSTYRIKG